MGNDTETRASFGQRAMQLFSSGKNSQHTTTFLESLGAVKNAPGIRYILMHGKQLSTSCRAGIFDTKAKTWVFRLDKAHHGVKHPHVNINYKITGVRDPHIKVPGGIVATGEALSKTAQTVATAACVCAVCIDSYRIGKSWYDDYSQSGSVLPGKNVAETGTSVAATWVGGMSGALMGSLTFSTIGSVIGFPFGPVGSVVGSSVLGLFGYMAGGVCGSFAGNNLAQNGMSNVSKRHVLEAFVSILNYIPAGCAFSWSGSCGHPSSGGEINFDTKSTSPGISRSRPAE